MAAPRFARSCLCDATFDHSFHDAYAFVLRYTGMNMIVECVSGATVIKLVFGVHNHHAERVLEETCSVDDVGPISSEPGYVVHNHYIEMLVGRVPDHLLKVLSTFNLAARLGFVNIVLGEMPSLILTESFDGLPLTWDAGVVALDLARCAAVPDSREFRFSL
tara:strand:+ start:160 stop:645 length:486 start_codon:yes stop_codon:yes gene_type:complete